MSRMIPEVVCSGAASERLVRALAPFGLVARRGESPPRADARAVGEILAMRPGEVALVTGPSGCGKSTLLRGAASAAAGQGVVQAERLPARRAGGGAIIDLFTGSVARSRRVLSLAGLGEAGLWGRSPAELSEGQRARLGLALAMARAEQRRASLVLIDEFCSSLDRVTVRGVARAVRAWSRAAASARIVCATSHDDVAEWLRPDLTIRPGGGL
ncbi:MAG TPA: hypothetical protein VFF69_06560 [Phycisphaerales bacterium]|nr:hypothetical protein [Phycisphaerales bacterium]